MNKPKGSNPLPHLQSSFTSKADFVTVDWYDALSSLPDLPWQQVYVIGDIDGKVPVVHYAGADERDNLPGGKTEPNETIEDTIKREMREELNSDVILWRPLGYQECREPNGQVFYQLRVAAKLRPYGEFQNDPGGSVIGYSLILLNELNERIQYGKVGDRLVKLAGDLDEFSFT